MAAAVLCTSLLLAFMAPAGSLATPLDKRASSAATLASVTSAQWNELSQQVGGRLHNAQPVSVPCYWNYNGARRSPNSFTCSPVQNSKNNAAWITAQPGGYIYSNWAGCQAKGQACPMSYFSPANPFETYTTPCLQGSVANMYIDVRSVADVQAGLAFAKANNVPLTIKNTGHDYKGRSAGQGTLALWMHNVKPAITLNNNFKPEGGAATISNVITFGAGEQFDAIYSFANKNKLDIAGGSDGTVGAAGGWITGGGHSCMSNTLGLGVDNVQQIRAVLPNGQYVTANRYQNTDVFFALRGGGGGAFGVVMEVSMLAHPQKPLQVGTYGLGVLNEAKVRTLMTILVTNADKWANEGFGGYISPGVVGNGISFITMASPKLTTVQAQASLKPITDFVNSQTSYGWASSVKQLSSYYELFASAKSSPIQQPSNIGAALTSRLVPRKYFQGSGNQQKMIQLLVDIVKAGQQGSNTAQLPLFINIVTPSSYTVPTSDQAGGPGEASVTPAWRTAIWHVIHTRLWDPVSYNAAAVTDQFQRAHDAMQPLRNFTPDGGAYQNEADAYEPDPINSFWGQTHYNRLTSIKKKIDPTNLLTCRECIGWDSTDPRWGCYPAVH